MKQLKGILGIVVGCVLSFFSCSSNQDSFSTPQKEVNSTGKGSKKQIEEKKDHPGVRDDHAENKGAPQKKENLPINRPMYE